MTHDLNCTERASCVINELLFTNENVLMDLTKYFCFVSLYRNVVGVGNPVKFSQLLQPVYITSQNSRKNICHHQISNEFSSFIVFSYHLKQFSDLSLKLWFPNHFTLTVNYFSSNYGPYLLVFLINELQQVNSFSANERVACYH